MEGSIDLRVLAYNHADSDVLSRYPYNSWPSCIMGIAAQGFRSHDLQGPASTSPHFKSRTERNLS